jgi:hypothetical protein
MAKFLLPLFLALSLVGCAADVTKTVQPDGTVVISEEEGFLEKLGQFTKVDVEAAMALAGDSDLDGVVDPDVTGDPIALQCYAYLHTKLGAAPQGITVAGVISGFQAARNIKRRVGGGFSDEFTLGCGALLTDVRGTLLKLGARSVLPF